MPKISVRFFECNLKKILFMTNCKKLQALENKENKIQNSRQSINVDNLRENSGNGAGTFVRPIHLAVLQI